MSSLDGLLVAKFNFQKPQFAAIKGTFTQETCIQIFSYPDMILRIKCRVQNILIYRGFTVLRDALAGICTNTQTAFVCCHRSSSFYWPVKILS